MNRTNVRILLVEDNPGDVWIIKDSIKTRAALFGAAGEIEVFTDGQSALERIDTLASPRGDSGFDLLIADLNLPRLSGHAIIAAWQKSTHAALPVIVVTSSNTNRETIAPNLGPLYYFQKPMDLNAYAEIGDMVQKALSESKP